MAQDRKMRLRWAQGPFLTPNYFLGFCGRPSGPETFGHPPEVSLYFCVYVRMHCTVSLCIGRESEVGLLVKMWEVHWLHANCFLKSVGKEGKDTEQC